MAKQKSIIKINGSLGALSFYQDKVNGNIVRQKGGPSKEHIQTSETCEVVRQNNSVFGTASSAQKLVRESFHSLTNLCPDPILKNRLQKKLMEILRYDTGQMPGSQLFLKEHFKHFGVMELRADSKPGDYFRFPIERALQGNELTIEAKVVAKIPSEKEATHFKVVSVAAYIDFKKRKQVHDAIFTEHFPLSKPKTLHLTHTLKGKGILFHGMCVTIYQKVNSDFYLLNEAGLNRGFIEWVA